MLQYLLLCVVPQTRTGRRGVPWATYVRAKAYVVVFHQ